MSLVNKDTRERKEIRGHPEKSALRVQLDLRGLEVPWE